MFNIVVNGIPFNVWNAGPYTLHEIVESPGFYYISGVDGVNCLSVHFEGKLRAIFDKSQADSILYMLEPYQPKAAQPASEKIEQTEEKHIDTAPDNS